VPFKQEDLNRYIKRMRVLNSQLIDIAQDIATTTKTSSAYYNRVNRNIKQIYMEMRTISQLFGDDMVPQVYKDKMSEEFRKIKAMKFSPPQDPGGIIANLKKPVNVQSINSLMNEFNSTMVIGLDSGQKTLTRLLSVTQQIHLQENQIRKAINDGFIDKGSTWGSQKELQKQLLAKSLDGKTITIVNKNGKVIRWRADKYAEMVSRTLLRQTQSLATINTAQSFGSDLVQVSSHNTTTRICIPFEGKIFSISGSDPQFAPLTDVPPFHPNCLHSISTVFKEVLQDRGIDKYSDFSLGKTEIHPTRTSHIPISDREL
jgi:hypothetical protein